MTLQLEIVSEHREIVGDDAVHQFHDEGGTIGRSLQNDWILPDTDRYISGRHATIDYKGGIYYLLDTSTNGVYINGGCEPIGNGNPRRLFNGDRLRLGDFEIVVSIDHGESLVTPLDDTGFGGLGHNASLVDEDPLKTGMLLLDENEITGDDDFQSALFGGPIETDVAEVEPEPLAPVPIETPKPAAAPLAEADLVAKDLLDAFLKGLGIERSELHPSTNVDEVMHNAGEVIREFVEGTTKLLNSRANLKNAFRLDQTSVLPKHNNPLKLSANVRDSIKQLLVGREGEYLGPRNAVREVCNDLLFHQDAFLDAMDSAFTEFAERFDPDELESSFEQTLNANFITKPFTKKKYWSLYRDFYPAITTTVEGRFPQMYAGAFINAYETQIAAYKQMAGAEDLKETVVLDPQHRAPSNIAEPSNDAVLPAADLLDIEPDDQAQV